MKTNDENEFLRSTGKNGEKRNGSASDFSVGVKENRKRGLSVFSFFFGFLIVIQMSCSRQEQPLISNEKLLQEKIKIGSVVKIRDLFDIDAESICVLNPYQETVSTKNEASNKINSYLRATEYKGNEAHWSLVSLKGEVSRVFIFRRTGLVDLASSGLSGLAEIELPTGFEIRECAKFSDAALFKFKFDNRIYIIFGSAK